ncbi:MAG: hypothetical protein RL431_966 [Actinomycetota bacterium]
MELVLKTSGQKCLAGSNPAPSAEGGIMADKGTPVARHGAQRERHPWSLIVRIIGLAMVTLLVSGVAVGGLVFWKLNSSIDKVSLVGEGETQLNLSSIGSYDGGFNILIVGSDTRQGQDGSFGSFSSELNDVNLLVHVAEDHQSAVVVSIPRDMVVPIPSCPMEDGSGNYAAMSAQPINVALSYGGLACAVLTVENLTGLDIPYAGLVTFKGVAQLSTAIGGVDVCVDGPIDDKYTGLYFPEAGNYTIEGYDALAFLRSRHGVGDGSDLGRISSQQQYMSSLVRKVQDEGVLSDITKLYSIAQVAATSMSLSNSLAGLDVMVAMALVLKEIPRENIVFVQYPGTTGVGGVYAGKVAPIESLATALFDKIRNDERFTLAGDATGVGSTQVDDTTDSGSTETPDPDATDSGTDSASSEELQGVLGQTADQFTCSVAN